MKSYITTMLKKNEEYANEAKKDFSKNKKEKN